MLFSSFTTPTLSAIFTLSFWVMGHLVADMRNFAATTDKAVFVKTLTTLTKVIPDLERFNLKNWAVYGDPISLNVILLTVCLGLIYVIFFLAGAVFIFERRDFK